MSEQQVVEKVVALFGAGPTHWIAQQVGITDKEVQLIHTAYFAGRNSR